jgi:hypothetical protein
MLPVGAVRSTAARLGIAVRRRLVILWFPGNTPERLLSQAQINLSDQCIPEIDKTRIDFIDGGAYFWLRILRPPHHASKALIHARRGKFRSHCTARPFHDLDRRTVWGINWTSDENLEKHRTQ